MMKIQLKTTRNYIPTNNFSTPPMTTFNPLIPPFNTLITHERRLRILPILLKQQTLLKKYFSSYSNTSFSYKPSKDITNCFIIMSDLDNKDIFNKSIKKFNLSIDKRYTVYIKVRYNLNMFFMLGNQFGFHYISDNSLSELYDDINIKLLEYFKLCPCRSAKLNRINAVHKYLELRELKAHLASDNSILGKTWKKFLLKWSKFEK